MIHKHMVKRIEPGSIAGELGMQTADGYAQFFALARSYTHLDELDRDTLVTFVDRIEIGPKIYENGGHKVPARANQPYRQSVRIFYKFIGELAEGGEKNSAEKPA